jgi:hypothetical protein
MTHTRLLLAYVILVGLPLLALIGILRAGQLVKPPVSLAGAWDVQADLNTVANVACRQWLVGIPQPFFSIVQSGASVTLSLNDSAKTTLAGTLRAGALSANPPTSAGHICSDTGTIRVEAKVSTPPGQRILTGLLALSDCDQCSPVPFRAVRREGDHKEGR